MAVVGFSFGLSLLVVSNSNKNVEKIFDTKSAEYRLHISRGTPARGVTVKL